VQKNSRVSFSRKVSSITGHGSFKYHDYIVSKGTVSKICDLCDGGYTQDAEHIFRECEKFFIPRQIIFGNDKPDLRLITDAQLSTFIEETDFPWFPVEEGNDIVDVGERESVASEITNNSSIIINQNDNQNDSDTPGYDLFDSDIDSINDPEWGPSDQSIQSTPDTPNSPLNIGNLDPNSEWLQSSSDTDSDIDESQFLLNADDMLDDSEYGSTSSDNSSLNDFIINDEYIDDEIIHNNDSDTDSEIENFLVDPEGLNLINPFHQNSETDAINDYDSELDHYLLDPEGLNLGNQDNSDTDNELVIGLDPEPSPGPVDPG